ncbi:conserved hypothetical protein [uncultured Paludibacter sp.]|uniref:Methyltransferase type 11 domain-containing protein n=1 Tax=uncultured Paludibacter sp. TaxID=497635 RepID=A0A653ABS5_9BACT|nr:conserved hypothetical protein [uncultured Paludibacter sp.]
MQERHSDRELYFQEQTFVTEKYTLPYINKVLKTTGGMIVAEIGCGEGGNLKPFLDRGCEIIGIDIAANKIENAEKFYNSHPNKERTKFIAEDIYKINPNDIQKCDLIIMRDTIEHIPNQRVFFE